GHSVDPARWRAHVVRHGCDRKFSVPENSTERRTAWRAERVTRARAVNFSAMPHRSAPVGLPLMAPGRGPPRSFPAGPRSITGISRSPGEAGWSMRPWPLLPDNADGLTDRDRPAAYVRSTREP